MWPDRVSNPGPLAHEPDELPTALRGPYIKTMWGLIMKACVQWSCEKISARVRIELGPLDQ